MTERSPSPEPPTRPPAGQARSTHVMAYGVHVLTAFGAALGFLALAEALRGSIMACFGWLGLALLVDALDGPLARRFKVSETASRYDGATLDLVVDFITYVFVPAAILLRPEILPHPFGLIAGMVMTIGSALYFADTRMKTEDWWFRGFPACWNIVVFYLVIFRPGGWTSLAIVAFFTLAMFLPMPFVHPFRVRRWRMVTMLSLAIWALAAASAVFLEALAPHSLTKGVLIAGAVYFLGLGMLRDVPPQDMPTDAP